MKRETANIRTPDGTADAVLFHPDGGSQPGVLVLTDIFGIRPAFEDLCERIASHGYAVLMPNIFYRSGKPPFFEFPVNLEDEATLARMKEITTPLSSQAVDRDAAAYVDFLSYESKGPMGVVGFCLTGKFAIRIAALRPEKVAAAASFHGGGLATADSESPHHLLPKIKAQLYFGHAENDRSMPAESIDRLDQALREWGGKYGSEIYPAGHGWMIPGRPVYNEQEAEKGFQELISLFDSSLKSPVASESAF